MLLMCVTTNALQDAPICGATFEASSASGNHRMDLLSLLRDNLWGFAGALLALVTLLVALRAAKVLEVSIEERELVGIKDDLDGRLKLLFKGVPKSAIWLVTVSFMKRGTHPVVPADFHKPLTIHLPSERGEILSYSVQSAHPEQLEIKCCQTQPGAVTVSPLVLNSGDHFTIELLVSDYKASALQLDYRIAGLPQIVRVHDFERKKFFPNWVGNLVALGLTLWVASQLDPDLGNTPFRAMVTLTAIIATAVTVAEVYVIRPIFRRWGHKLRFVRGSD